MTYIKAAHGIPAGGTNGQVLSKTSGSDYAAGWIDPPAGGTGSTWRTGSGAPSNSLGVDGDFYLNTANADVYKRASGTYSVVANIKGATGTNGTNGAAATVAIGTVTTGAAGTSASVTNVGTSSAAVLDITIPRGAAGGSGGLPGGMVDLVATYSADPTGVADSTTALLNAMNSGAAIVWLPPGTYKYNPATLGPWDQEINLWGPGARFVTLKPTGSTFGLILRPPSSASRTTFRGFTLDGSNNTQSSSLCGLLVQRKVIGDDVIVKNFNGTGIRYAPYDASTTDGSGGTIGNSVFFSRWMDCTVSDCGGDGWDVRMGANANGFINCQAIRNKGKGWRHRTDGGATYGNWWLGGQGSYNSAEGYDLTGGTDIRTYALYSEYNFSPTNTNTDGYTGSPVDIAASASRSEIDTGVLFNQSATHVNAPGKGANDATVVKAGGQRIYGSTKYMTPVRTTAPTNSTAATLAQLVADHNALLTFIKSAGLGS